MRRYDKIILLLELCIVIEMLLAVILYQISPIASITTMIVCSVIIIIGTIVAYHTRD